MWRSRRASPSPCIMKKLALSSAAVLFGLVLATMATPSNGRSISVNCDGTISHHPLSAYTAIAKNGENVCIFATNYSDLPRMVKQRLRSKRP